MLGILKLVFIFGCRILLASPVFDHINTLKRRDDGGNVCTNNQPPKLSGECKVQFLHEEDDIGCIKERKLHLLKQKHIYQITQPPQNNSNGDFVSSPNSKTAISAILPNVPWLNRTYDEVLGYFSFSDEESRYMGMFTSYIKYLIKVEKKIRDVMFVKLKNQTLIPSYEVYYQITEAFNQQIKKLRTKHVTNPCLDKDCSSTLRKKGWPTDDLYFVQRRLAGSCPFSLKKVTVNSPIGMPLKDLKKKINWNFDYDKAITESFGETINFQEAIKKGLLYVLHHPQHDDVTKLSPEFGANNTNRSLRELNNPITLFVLGRNGEFRVVSIQIDNVPGSQVLKPSTSDTESWTKAKAEVELADSNICQGFYHAGKVHLTGTIYCLSYRHHIDQYHPLYDFFVNHCEGTVPHISLVYYTLFTSGQRSDMCLSMGHEGFVKLGKMAFDQRMYGEFDLPTIIKNGGLDDERISYYPFRDDASLLWDELSGFTNDVVQQLYKNDGDVIKDTSLQSLANGLSTNGVGNMPGFPSSFKTKQSLRLFLLRFLWYNVMHTSMNYPLNLYSLVSAPTKLYDDIHGQPLSNHLQTLPDLYTAVNTSSFSTNIANFRANRILDYRNKVRHGLKSVITNGYKRFHTCLQNELSTRNEKRRSKQYLGFEYFEPKYLTNSVHV